MTQDTLCTCPGKPLSLADCAFGDDLQADSHALPLTQRLALNCDECATAFGVSPRFWRALDSAGKVPRARRLGKAKRWDLDELRRWTACGCPGRAEWEQLDQKNIDRLRRGS
jgi:hypothetical protein